MRSARLRYQDMTFEEWREKLRNIYGHKNKYRSLSEMWLRVVSDASKVGEAVRKMEPFEAMDSLARTFAWIITTADKMLVIEYEEHPALERYDGQPHTTLTDVILAKYPTICPYCEGCPCICPSKRRTIEKETKEERRKRLRKILINTHDYRNYKYLPNNKNITVSWIARMFDDIYGEVHYGVHIEDITYHFFEEIGEVAQCITNLENGVIENDDTVPITVQLSEELADVIGWGFAVMNKFGELARQSNKIMDALFSQTVTENSNQYGISGVNRETMLARWLWYKFYDQNRAVFVCHKCKQEQCECKYEKS